MSEHLSRRLLEQASIDDVPADERARATAHLAECATCREVVARLQGEATAHLAAHPPERFMMQVSARRARSRRRPIVATISVLAAAALVIFFLRPRDDVRFKGDGVTVYVRRGGETRVLPANDPIAAGDTLQLAVTSAHPARASAWLVDGQEVHVVAENAAVGAGETSLGPSASIEPPCRDLIVVVARDRDATIEAVREVARGRQPRPGFATRTLRCR